MGAFHDSQTIKDRYTKRLQSHMDRDELIRGTGYENGRGCAVGCTLNKYDHAAYPEELGIPEWVAYLNDTLHEKTSEKVWPTLQLRFLTAIKPGIQFDQIHKDINLFIQHRNLKRVKSLDIPKEIKAQVTDAIQQVIEVIDSGWADEQATEAAASVAKSAARATEAAASVAEPAARTAIASAAESAARAAESAARAVAWAAESAAWAAESAAESAVWSAEPCEFDIIANEFIRLIEDTQVVVEVKEGEKRPHT